MVCLSYTPTNIIRHWAIAKWSQHRNTMINSRQTSTSLVLKSMPHPRKWFRMPSAQSKTKFRTLNQIYRKLRVAVPPQTQQAPFSMWATKLRLLIMEATCRARTAWPSHHSLMILSFLRPRYPSIQQKVDRKERIRSRAKTAYLKRNWIKTRRESIAIVTIPHQARMRLRPWRDTGLRLAKGHSLRASYLRMATGLTLLTKKIGQVWWRN